MERIAILAPTLEGVRPEQLARAQGAMARQMMLLAQGLPVDHPAVRSAAELVGSAVALEPPALELAKSPGARPAGTNGPRRSVIPAPGDAPAAGASRPETYARYLETIFRTPSD